MTKGTKRTVIPRAKWTPALREQLKAMVESGLSASEIAGLTARTKLSVIGQARTMGLSFSGEDAHSARMFLKGRTSETFGGFAIREEVDLGDNRVVYWTAAHRSNDVRFPTNYMEAMKDHGLIVIHDGRYPNTYRIRIHGDQ